MDDMQADNAYSRKVDGKAVTVMNFKESFPHHCDYVWMVADGLKQSMKEKLSFRDYVERHNPRASYPHHITIHRIASCIVSLQSKMQEQALSKHGEEFDFLDCWGLELDMWTNTDTHVVYACLILSLVKDSESEKSLELESEALEFGEFPHTKHSAENIAEWIIDVLEANKIRCKSISGVTPDGAADGRAALRLTDLKSKVDVCLNHDLNRIILYGLGLAGSTSRNPDCKEVIKVNRRVPCLSNQSRHVCDGIRKRQIKCGVPATKVLTTTDTCPTRWGNQYDQIEKNLVLLPVHGPVIEEHKAASRRKNKDVILIEDSLDDSGKRVSVAAVKGSSLQLPMSEEKIKQSQELEAVLRQPATIHKTIEFNKKVTGAQCVQMISAWQKTMHGPVVVLDTPKPPKLKHRKRKVMDPVPLAGCFKSTK